MSKSNDAEGVRVLRFFEEEPIEKAELLFNIISAKMLARRQSKAPNGADPSAKIRKSRKQQRPESGAATSGDLEIPANGKE